MNTAVKPNLSVTLSNEAFDFILWMQDQYDVSVTRSAIIEKAVLEMAERAGYPPKDKAANGEEKRADVI